MKVLVTGAKGFVGKNLVAMLQNIRDKKIAKFSERSDVEVLSCDIDTTDTELENYCEKCNFVIHLAGVNRPQNVNEFMEGNFGFTTKLLNCLKKHKNTSPIIMSSSIQAKLDNDYGKSKKAGEDYLRQYGIENNVKVYIFRLPNVFGKWCRPNYNSVVATFCNNIANGLPISISDPNIKLTFVYIDDVVSSFLEALFYGKALDKEGFCTIPVFHDTTLGYLASTITAFKETRATKMAPRLAPNSFEKKLYATYLSYLPKTEFKYELKSNIDNRGSFTEIIKTIEYGQVSVNISKPHIVKGNHWHNTKNEKFLVVKGNGVIRFRNINSDEIIEYYVSDQKLEVVDIPTGYTHNIENLGEDDMVTIMWASEMFDPQNPDTYYLEV